MGTCREPTVLYFFRFLPDASSIFLFTYISRISKDCPQLWKGREIAFEKKFLGLSINIAKTLIWDHGLCSGFLRESCTQFYTIYHNCKPSQGPKLGAEFVVQSRQAAVERVRGERKKVLKLFKLCCLKLAGPLSLTRHSSGTMLCCTLSAEYCHLWCNGQGPQPKDMALYVWHRRTLVQPWIKRRQARETVSIKHTKVTLKELYTKWFHFHVSYRSHTVPFHLGLRLLSTCPIPLYLHILSM